MTKSVATKMGLREGSRVLLRNAPEGFLQQIDAPELNLDSHTSGEFDYLHLFVRSQAEMEQQFAVMKPHLAEKGALWVSWPKGGQLGTDLNLHHVIRIGYERGLVESTCLSIDSTWSALKFTHPKPGKVYSNSHAELVLE